MAVKADGVLVLTNENILRPMLAVLALELLAWLPPRGSRASTSGHIDIWAHRYQMSISPRVEALNIVAADAESLEEAASFFVEAFWLASTTFGGQMKLSAGERAQLQRIVSKDLGSRYGLTRGQGGSAESSSLFWSKLIVAREPGNGAIVGLLLEAPQTLAFNATLQRHHLSRCPRAGALHLTFGPLACNPCMACTCQPRRA